MDDSAPLKEKIAAPTDSKKITWIDVIGLHDVETISAIGENFGIATLVLEDILNTAGRPKIEDFDAFLFAVIRMITQGKVAVEGERSEIESQYFAVLLLPNNVVITFREATGGVIYVFQTQEVAVREKREVGGEVK